MRRRLLTGEPTSDGLDFVGDVGRFDLRCLRGINIDRNFVDLDGVGMLLLTHRGSPLRDRCGALAFSWA
ncbi:hypothetical protein DJ71_27900 [Halorubrum sp. E3]|nr:hypothetical protein DJ71_27900 [Halorubrum sp. E3]